MFYADDDIYTLHQSQPLQAILHFQASTTLPDETFIVSIVHKALRKKSTFLKLRQLFVAALIFGAARDSKGPVVDTSALSETTLCHVACARRCSTWKGIQHRAENMATMTKKKRKHEEDEDVPMTNTADGEKKKKKKKSKSKDE
ncbi:hypothetical protein T069G_01967 [Trichoderma breve]|uniref:Uncharacterized protein n=1 Tax=Trichoderma breve TaxID=2034170 RepID=A0A9W9EEP4_9HYPO|nr:hypothetical protein T069G_01967 [Trichoderma breve]KAJ4865437.1 hypothetical protein T069G_01967 [Trichoderma breve]